VNNNSAEASATALDLRVEPGRAPMKVHSEARVANLNASELDGQEARVFMHARTYRVDKPITIDVMFSTAVLCDTGDRAIGSVWAGKDAGTEKGYGGAEHSQPGGNNVPHQQRLATARRHGPDGRLRRPAAAAIVSRQHFSRSAFPLSCSY
jgi:hypothetical protein